MIADQSLSVAKVAEWMASEDLHAQWRREVDQVIADVLVLARRRLFISAAKRMGEARKALELHTQKPKVLSTLNALADAISAWDSAASIELANRLRTEL